MRDCIKTKDIWLPNPNELDNTTKTFNANKNSPKQSNGVQERKPTTTY